MPHMCMVRSMVSFFHFWFKRLLNVLSSWQCKVGAPEIPVGLRYVLINDWLTLLVLGLVLLA